MLDLATLLKLTPKEILHRGYNECQVTVRKVEMKKDYHGPHKYCSGTVRSSDGSKVVEIKFYDPYNPKIAYSPIWVHCNCEYYKYTVEVVNNKKGSSPIRSSNGREPRIRNPKKITHLCKHLVAFAKAVWNRKPAQMELFEESEMDRLHKEKQLQLKMKRDTGLKKPPALKQPPKPRALVGPKPIKPPTPIRGVVPTRPAKP